MRIEPDRHGVVARAEREGRLLCQRCAQDRVGERQRALNRGDRVFRDECPVCHNRRRAVYVWHEPPTAAEAGLALGGIIMVVVLLLVGLASCP